jgi:hypothetical protein
VAPPLPDLVLYTRPGCHLCDEARDSIQSVLEDRAARGLPIPRRVERDIDRDPDLRAAYGATIPVVELGDRRLDLAISAGRIRRLLTQTLDEGVDLA